MKSHGNFFRYTILKLHIFPCIITMISNLTRIFSFKYLFSNFSFQIKHVFATSYDSCCSFVNNFIFFFLKLIIFIACSLKVSKKIFIQSLALHKLRLFFTLVNDDTIDIEKTLWNKFTYSCCRWNFRITFTFINLFY